MQELMEGLSEALDGEFSSIVLVFAEKVLLINLINLIIKKERKREELPTQEKTCNAMAAVLQANMIYKQISRRCRARMAEMNGRMIFHQAPGELSHFKILSVQALNRNPRSTYPSPHKVDSPPIRKSFGLPFL